MHLALKGHESLSPLLVQTRDYSAATLELKVSTIKFKLVVALYFSHDTDIPMVEILVTTSMKILKSLSSPLVQGHHYRPLGFGRANW